GHAVEYRRRLGQRAGQHLTTDNFVRPPLHEQPVRYLSLVKDHEAEPIVVTLPLGLRQEATNLLSRSIENLWINQWPVQRREYVMNTVDLQRPRVFFPYSEEPVGARAILRKQIHSECTPSRRHQ